ncbi:MAG: DMT family transporter [Lachnospiraceae bacterium]|nr:DMT family transporter [Lachnospiraceae bacterium]
MKKWLGVFMLLLTALIWGTAFVAQSVGMDYVEPFTFNFSRYIIGALVLVPFAIISLKKKLSNFDSNNSSHNNSNNNTVLDKSINVEKPNKKAFLNSSILGGIGCGVLLCVASMLQQYGILYTNSVGKAGFLTALYIIMVPIIGIFFKKKVKPLIWVCVILATVGLYLLCVKDGFSFEIGDIFLILCALVFSFHIILVDYVSPRGDGVTISMIQFGVSAVLCFICALIFEHVSMANILRAWMPILYAGVMSCGVAYTFQILGQKYVEPTKASLILCLESVFATLGGWVILKEVLSLREAIGCIVVFIAIILAQFVQYNKTNSTE